MEAPHRVTTEMFNQLVDLWIDEHAVNPVSDVLICKHCGDQILWKRSFMSIHTEFLSICAGHGEVTNPTLPFCPTCETDWQQTIYGCLHADPAPVQVPHPAPPPNRKVHPAYYWFLIIVLVATITALHFVTK